MGQATVSSTLDLVEWCDSTIYDPYDDFHWIINGQAIEPSTQPVDLNTNYPEEDTIIFWNTTSKWSRKKDTTYTRFQPDQKYLFDLNFHSERYNVFEKEHWTKHFGSFDYDSSTLEEFREVWCPAIEWGKVKFQITNLPKNDSLLITYGVIDDGYLTGTIISKKNSHWITPRLEPFNSSNIQIVISKILPNAELNEDEIPNQHYIRTTELKDLAWFKIRIFNNEKVKITYDYETGEIVRKFEH